VTTPATPSPAEGVDLDNPWPGLASFTEDLRGFFFGREKETEELVRLIRRNTLTVLFGQSGLGKSSLLQAGVFPVLREADFLPVYLRLDHDPDGPPLADQVKGALVVAFRSVGADAPAPRADQTLWEYFHSKDIDIWSPKNRLLTPVLAFDQFEEIFTLGRADDARRERGRMFLTELADLVENRPPAGLRARFESGDVDATRFAFDKPSCQVVLSLREDFLPDLEGLKGELRSLMHSRMRICRLTGIQALEIVTRPAPQLLAEGVAERVVEFVSGGRGGSVERLAELEIEPALLSVICRELNQRRRALGQEKITADLVSGNRREILTDFYERSVADLPAAAREFVEDRLLTKSGFRDNLALETVLETPGVTRKLIDTLVSRRLLRIEDRFGVQRVELTHDVLADVIRSSRDSRHERRDKGEAARKLAEMKAGEEAALRGLRRARAIAVGCAVLALVAIASAIFGYVGMRRAQVAEQRARAAEVAALAAQVDLQHSRHQVDTARLEAEQLLSFLLGEFQSRLIATGQLDLFEKLARRTLDYYNNLDAGLVSTSTERNRAVAMALLGSVLNRQNRMDEAGAMEAQSVAIFRRLISEGDRSMETAKQFSLALGLQGDVFRNQNLRLENQKVCTEAVAILRPFMVDAKAKKTLRADFAAALMNLGWVDQFLGEKAAKAEFAEAAALLVAAGAEDPKNEDLAAQYSICLKGLTYRVLFTDKDTLEARRLIGKAIELQDSILKQSPSRLEMVEERAGAYTARGYVDYFDHDLKAIVADLEQSDRDYEFYLQLNPTDGKVRQYAVANKNFLSESLRRLGRLSEALRFQKAALVDSTKHIQSKGSATSLSEGYYALAKWMAEGGDRVGAEQAVDDDIRIMGFAAKDAPPEGDAALNLRFWTILDRALIGWILGDSPVAAEREVRALVPEVLRAVQTGEDADVRARNRDRLAIAYHYIADADLTLGRFSDAERSARQAVEAWRAVDPAETDDLSELAEALARQGRNAEARTTLEPAVASFRNLVKLDPENLVWKWNLSDLLIVQAMAQEPQSDAERLALLNEARALLAILPEEVTHTQFYHRQVERLAAEQAKVGSKP
jgi:tetratricopeptide (TPR) repeat protein